jgi:lysozyme
MTTPYLMADLEHDEGFRAQPYQDTLGVWTNGCGHTQGVDESTPPVTLAQARAQLAATVTAVMHDLDLALPWWRSLNDVRQDVLVNMAFNLGVRGLLRFTHTLAAIRGGCFGLASAGMLGSRWATEVGERARRLAEQMESGIRP